MVANISTNVSKGSTKNAASSIVIVYSKNFWRKRPLMARSGEILHWDNVSVLMATVIQVWFAANGVERLLDPPNSPDVALAD